MASMMARVFLRLMRFSDARAAAAPAGVHEPDARVVLRHLLGEQLGIFARMPDEEWSAKHGENTVCGSVTPISVPATFAV